jgi:plastocyanin
MVWLRVCAALAVCALVAPAFALAQKTTATKVTVTLTDTKLGISPTGLEAGSTTFTVVNHGKRLHALQITGPGLKKGLATAKLDPGKSATMTLDLRSGAYMLTLSNPVGMGMSATHWLQVIPHTVVKSNGSGVVQDPGPLPSPVCGGVMP